MHSAIESAPAPAALPTAPAGAFAAHKFGGSSLADASCFRRVAAILRSQPEPGQLVVVSAMRGTTDALIALAEAAAHGAEWRSSFDELCARHVATVRELAGDAAPTLPWLECRFAELAELLHALGVLGTSSREALERIHGFGEVWSARMLADHLRGPSVDCACLDARDVLVVTHGELGAAVDWDESARRFAAWRVTNPAAWCIVAGFVARTRDGRPTVLGRNGSDYSASIFAALAGASELTLWGDTDGVLSADPRLVPEAVPVDALSYDEACELAYFGAKVIHPQTLTPAISRRLPVRIRNTFRPEHAGTRIDAARAVRDDAGAPPVKGLSAVGDLALITLEGAGMIGVPGTAERTFGALRAAAVSVVMISQGSSEHSICCVVRAGESDAAVNALRLAFAAELARGEIHSVGMAVGVSVLAAVGDGMAGTPGVAARLFGALARTGVNIRAIAQGASERNISVAVAAADAPRALRAAHAAFWLSPQTLSIGIVGYGKVGAALLRQIDAARARFVAAANLDLRVRAIATSRTMWLGESGDADRAATAPCDIDRLEAHVHVEHLPHSLIVDCSASDAIADRYAPWLAAGIHVVTPNKHAGAGPLARWQAIRAALASGSARFRYEATVGAGLPVISTLRDLIDTGDEMLAVEGILSGTLAWLFNRYDGTRAFSDLVREAHALGYTEPDPREDLAGTDVARKLVILAREAGGRLALGDVAIESLVPEALGALGPSEFLERAAELDATIETRYRRTRASGRALRYVARLDREGRASVGLVEIEPGHAFAHLRLTDNIVQFTTRRYHNNPLVVQGPGAGPEVTAAGVFADVLRVAANLGARL